MKQFRLNPLAAAVTLALFGTQAFAQQAAPSDTEIDKVVVTSNKRAQVLSDVPQPITVLNDAALQRANVRDLDDLPALSPALTLTYSTQPGNYSINMRGIGTFSLGIGVEADVSVVVDDVPLGMQAAAFKDLADVQRVEVLKGPQSTLFGKSSIAGALNITTKPIGGPMRASTSVLVTNDQEKRFSGVVAGSLSDTVDARLIYSKTDFPGIVTNVKDGSKLNGAQGETLMAKVAWRPTDNLEVSFSPFYNVADKNCCVQPYLAMTPGGLYQNTAQLPASVLLQGVTIGPGNLTVRNDYPAGGNAHSSGASLRVNYALDQGGSLAWIASRSGYKMRDYQDGDATDGDIMGSLKVNNVLTGLHGGLYQYGIFKVFSTTQELRLTSSDQGPFKYVAGLWYGHNDLARELIRAPASSYVTDYQATTYNTSYAVFGESTYDLTSKTSLVAGLRLNREDTGYTFTRFTPPPAAAVPTEFYQQDDSNNSVTGRLGLKHNVTKDLMVYGTYSTGHKGVAYDLTSGFTAANAKFQPVPAEKAKSFEAGFKTMFWDNRASLDVAVFKTNFTGFQQSAGFTDSDGVFRTTLHSIGELQTQGVEVEASLRPTRNLQLNGSFAYVDATIVDFENGPCYAVLNTAGTGTVVGPGCAANPKFNNSNVANLAGKTLPNAPKYKLNLTGQYDIQLDSQPFNAFVTTNYRYQSATQFNLNQDPMTIQGGYSITNASFGIKDKKDRYKFSLFVNNLFDKTYAASLANGLANGTWSSKAPNPVVVVNTFSWTPPRDVSRYFGARLDMNF